MGINRFKKGDRARPTERIVEIAEKIGAQLPHATVARLDHRATVLDTGEFDAGEAELIYVQWDHQDEPSTCHPNNLIPVETRRSVWQRLMEDE